MVKTHGLSLLRLPLHPLMGSLPEEPLERALEAEMVHGVCRLGVDFGRALAHDHYGKMLPVLTRIPTLA